MNPNDILGMILNTTSLSQNPMFSNAMRMYQNGDTEGLKKMADNLCRQNGITPEEVMRRIMGGR